MALLLFPVALRYFFPYSPTLTSAGVALINSIMVSCIFILDEDIIKRITGLVFKIIAIICIIGLTFHILRFFGLYHSPQIAHVNVGDRQYSVFLLHVYEVSPYSGQDLSMRFNSIFDEPGYLGTIVALYLASRGFNLKNKWNIVLFVAGLFTLSLAFYIMSFAYLLLASLRSEGGYKRFFIILILVSALLFVFASLFPELVDLFLSRQEFLGEGRDSRGGLAAMSRNLDFLRSQPLLQVLFGSGYDAHLYVFGNNTGELSQSNFFRLVFQIGFVGVFYLLLFFFIGIKKTYTVIIFFVIFLLSMYQRPQVIDPLFILIISGQMCLQFKDPHKGSGTYPTHENDDESNSVITKKSV